MFFVINKEKIFSFVLALGMVGILLGMTGNMQKNENTVETSYVVTANEIQNETTGRNQIRNTKP